MLDPAIDGISTSHAPPCCLVLHGLGGGPYELAPLIEAMKARGWTVSAPVLPGHDGPGPAMPGSLWTEWATAAELAFDTLVQNEGRPVMVVGFSTGGTLALELATRRPIARMALLAPFMAIRFSGWIPIHPSKYIKVVARLLPDLPRRGPAVRDRSARRALGSASNFRTFSLAATLSALDLIAVVEPRLGSIVTPTLILQGRLDTVVEPSAAVRLLDRLGSKEKSLAWFPRSDHLLALDHEREAVIQAVLDFLER